MTMMLVTVMTTVTMMLSYNSLQISMNVPPNHVRMVGSVSMESTHSPANVHSTTMAPTVKYVSSKLHLITVMLSL